MILTNTANTLPMAFSGDFEASSMNVIFYPSENATDFCRSSLDCNVLELAFHSDDGAYHKNDKSSFLFQRLLPTDTAIFYILKDGVRQTAINNSNFGDFYNFGDLPNGNMIGVFIDWRLVFLTYGNGKFQIEIEFSRLGVNDKIISTNYWVRPYTAEAANGTVRIESVNNGNIINGIDFSGTNWSQWFRISGKLFDQKPQYESEYSKGSNWSENIVQKELFKEYTLDTELLHKDMLNNIQEFSLMGDSLILNDYNKYNADVYRKLAVELVDISRSEYDVNINASLNIKFRDKSTKVKRTI
jgi:hypothetical protein